MSAPAKRLTELELAIARHSYWRLQRLLFQRKDRELERRANQSPHAFLRLQAGE
jgi:hypothetical protein